MPLEMHGILIEQAPDIGFGGGGGRRPRAQAGEMQACAQFIPRIEFGGAFERLYGCLPMRQLVLRDSEHE